MTTHRWLITDYHHGWAIAQLHIKVTTDTLAHLWCRYTDKPLRVHNQSETIRGLTRIGQPYYCFVEFQELEQIELGDTLHHRFHMPAFGPGVERWFDFYGYRLGVLTNSLSPVFHVKYHEESEMITIGIYSEAETLEGEVKLEAGDNITLIRNDGHNSIEIHASAAVPDGFGFPWYTDLVPPGTPIFPDWRYDQLHIGINNVNHEARIYTDRHTIFDFLAPHSWELAADRGPNAAATQTVWMCMVASTLNLDADPTHRHIGWYHNNNRLYATNANGAAQTTTLIGVGRLSWRKWLKYHRHDGVIDFYEDGILVATHNTNIPAVLANCRYLFQFIGKTNAPREFYVTQPRYRP